MKKSNSLAYFTEDTSDMYSFSSQLLQNIATELCNAIFDMVLDKRDYFIDLLCSEYNKRFKEIKK